VAGEFNLNKEGGMNQTTNFTQWKNIEDKQKTEVDFENYSYECQCDLSWIRHNFEGDELVYRLVIEPDKYYYWAIRTSHSFNGIALGKDLLDEIPAGRDMISINQFDTLRPAKPSEIPKPEPTLEESKDCFSVGIRWKGGEFAKITLNNVEIDPRDLLIHIDFLSKAAE